MKVSEVRLRRLIAEAMAASPPSAPALHTDQSMSRLDQRMAQAMKMHFKRKYPQASVLIDRVLGIVLVNGKEAINLNSVSRKPRNRDEWWSMMEETLLADPSGLDEKALRLVIGQLLGEETHAFHGYKFGPSKMGLPGPEFDDEAAVTADDVDDGVNWLEDNDPSELVAFSRGSAVLHQMIQDEQDAAAEVPPVTYVSPAAMRDWTSAPVPGAPGGSKVVHSMGDNIVPLKQGCQVASQSGADMYIAPGKADGKDHVRTLKYRNGGGTKVDAAACAGDPDLPDWGGTGNASDEELAQQVKRGKELVAEHFFREFVKLLQEDPMGFVHDLAAASEEFGEPGEMFFGGDPGKGGGRAIKRAFNANADHQWLSTLNTVHWGDVYGLAALIGRGKDELSTLMSLPNEDFAVSGANTGLWVKGRITLAANDMDHLYSGHHFEYGPGKSLGGTEEEVAHRDRSSGRNKRPTTSKDYSRYGRLQRGNEFAEDTARNIPYVLDQSMWDSVRGGGEALVDNWKPLGLIPDWEVIQIIGKLSRGRELDEDPPGRVGKLFKLAREMGVPIFDRERNEIWSPE